MFAENLHDDTDSSGLEGLPLCPPPVMHLTSAVVAQLDVQAERYQSPFSTGITTSVPPFDNEEEANDQPHPQERQQQHRSVC